jgi:hypothetical protein
MEQKFAPYSLLELVNETIPANEHALGNPNSGMDMSIVNHD